MPGSEQAVSLAEAQAFFDTQPTQSSTDSRVGIMIKAIGGGGGRGMRAVQHAEELPEAYARCTSEALAAFGVAGVYVERLMLNARHIEVQVLGDGQQVGLDDAPAARRRALLRWRAVSSCSSSSSRVRPPGIRWHPLPRACGQSAVLSSFQERRCRRGRYDARPRSARCRGQAMFFRMTAARRG